MFPSLSRRSSLGACLAGFLALVSGGGAALLGNCGPFTDFTDAAFCPFVLEIFYLGITTGTTPTTYDPASPVTRLQMAAFLSRTVDGILTRGSRRAALDQFWNTQNASVLGITTVGPNPEVIASDGKDLWVAKFDGAVVRVRASDGKLLETWTGGTNNEGVLVAMGRVFVDDQVGSKLYRIDPALPAGALETVASGFGNGNPGQMAFDGSRIWTANWGFGGGGTVSIITPGTTIPWTTTTVTIGETLRGIAWDGSNIWVTDFGPDTLMKLDAAGSVLQTVTVGLNPSYLLFDGTNLWVPGVAGKLTVVRASTGAVLATLTGNGLTQSSQAAFDGKRVLVTSANGNSLSLWKAADLTPLGSFATGLGTSPYGVCSDGVNFWVTLAGTGQVARF